MRTRRSPRNQEILWRALGGPKEQPEPDGKETMTPAELKSARHALGLSIPRLAEMLSDSEHAKDGPSPVDPRNVRRWENGTRDIPHPVVVLVKSMLRLSLVRRRAPPVQTECPDCRDSLHVHHIDGNPLNNETGNLALVCRSCCGETK